MMSARSVERHGKFGIQAFWKFEITKIEHGFRFITGRDVVPGGNVRQDRLRGLIRGNLARCGNDRRRRSLRFLQKRPRGNETGGIQGFGQFHPSFRTDFRPRRRRGLRFRRLLIAGRVSRYAQCPKGGAPLVLEGVRNNQFRRKTGPFHADNPAYQRDGPRRSRRNAFAHGSFLLAHRRRRKYGARSLVRKSARSPFRRRRRARWRGQPRTGNAGIRGSLECVLIGGTEFPDG